MLQIHIDGYLPLRGAIAYLMTDNEEIVDYVCQSHQPELGQPDPLDSPVAQCRMILQLMRDEGCFKSIDTTAIYEWALNELVVVNPSYAGRFKLMTDSIIEKGPFRLGDIASSLLAIRSNDAVEMICSGIRDGRIAARAVPLYGDTVGRAAAIPAEAMTDTMMVCSKGRLYQERPIGNSIIPAFKSVFVRCADMRGLKGQPLVDCRLTIEQDVSAPISKIGRRGRKKGDGLLLADEPLLIEMREMIASGFANNPNHAASIIAMRSPAHMTKSMRERLGRKYRKRENQGLPLLF